MTPVKPEMPANQIVKESKAFEIAVIVFAMAMSIAAGVILAMSFRSVS
jgi:hypothetical protein